jgi:cation diffusion facilitator family transporter
MPIRVQRYIVLLSVLLFAAKLWAWTLTHSVTILTDALESIVNVVAGFIGLFSVMLAAKPRDLNHPYGHGKVEFISSAIEGSLIMMAGLMIIYEAVRQWIQPRPLTRLDWGILITLVTGILNYSMGQWAVRVGRRHRSLTVESAGRHLKSDAYSTAALVVGLLLLWVTGWRWLDSLVALIFAAFIILTGYRVLRRSLAGIMDEADEGLLRQMIEVLQHHRRPQWIDLHNLRVIQYGAVLHVDVHMTLPWYLQIKDGEVEIHALEDLIREHFGGRIELFVHTDACHYYQCRLCAMPECPVRQQQLQELVIWDMENVWNNEKHGKDRADQEDEIRGLG